MTKRKNSLFNIVVRRGLPCTPESVLYRSKYALPLCNLWKPYYRIVKDASDTNGFADPNEAEEEPSVRSSSTTFQNMFPVRDIDMEQMYTLYLLGDYSVYMQPSHQNEWAADENGKVVGSSDPIPFHVRSHNTAVRWRASDCAVYSVSGMTQVLLYDASERRIFETIKTKDCFIKDHKYFPWNRNMFGALGNTGRFQVADLMTGNMELGLVDENRVNQHAAIFQCHPTREHIVCTMLSNKSCIAYWDLRNSRVPSDMITWEGTIHPKPTFCFNEYGSMIISRPNHLRLHVWDADFKTLKLTVETPNRSQIVSENNNNFQLLLAATTSCNPGLAFTTDETVIRVYSLKNGRCVKVMRTHLRLIRHLRLNSVNQDLISACHTFPLLWRMGKPSNYSQG